MVKYINMKTPNSALWAVTAAAALSTLPGQAQAAEYMPTGPVSPEVTAANAAAAAAFPHLGGQVLKLQASAQHNSHLTSMRAASRGTQEWQLKLNYEAAQAAKHAGLGSYAITAIFDGSRKHASTSQLEDVTIAEKGGKNGPQATFELRKESDARYSFNSKFAFAKLHYAASLEATTNPQAGENWMNQQDVKTVSTEIKTILGADAPKGKAIKRIIKPPFAAHALTVEGAQTTTTAQQTLPNSSQASGAPSGSGQETTPPSSGQNPPPAGGGTSTPSTNTVKPGDWGVDMSFPNKNVVVPGGTTFVEIGENDGIVFSENPEFDNELAASAGKTVMVYGNISFNDKSSRLKPAVCAPSDTQEQCLAKEATQYGKDAADYDLDLLEAHDIPLQDLELGMDAESRKDSTWSTTNQLNRNAMQGFHDEVIAGGISEDHFMVYTDTVNWDDVTDEETPDGDVEHFNPGWDEWGFTTDSSLQEAYSDCTAFKPFTGTNAQTGRRGTIRFLQFTANTSSNNLDQDVACQPSA